MRTVFPVLSFAYGQIAVYGNLMARVTRGRDKLQRVALSGLARSVRWLHDDLNPARIGRHLDRPKIGEQSAQYPRAIRDDRDSLVLVAVRVTNDVGSAGALRHCDRLLAWRGSADHGVMLKSFARRGHRAHGKLDLLGSSPAHIRATA